MFAYISLWDVFCMKDERVLFIHGYHVCRMQSVRDSPAKSNITTELVGISGHYPGMGKGISGFYGSLESQEDLPYPVPYERWDIEQYYTPEARGALSMYVRMACFVGDLDAFDANLFRCVSPQPHLAAH